MGFLHGPELILLVLVALIIFGPKRLPEIGGALGKGIREFKRSTSDEEDLDVASRPVQIPPPQARDVRMPETPTETPVSVPERDVR